MMKGNTQTTKYAKGILALITFTLAGTVVAQESADKTDTTTNKTPSFTSKENLQEGVDQLRVSINPFSAESLRLYELRREVERLKLQKELDENTISAKDVEKLKALIVKYGAIQANTDTRMKNLEQRLDRGLEKVIIDATKVVNRALQGSANNSNNSNKAAAEVEITDVQANEGLTYGYVNFGFGPRLYYGGLGDKKFAGVNDYVLLPTSNGKREEVKITEITESHVLLENGDKIVFSDAQGFLNAPPEKAFGESEK